MIFRFQRLGQIYCPNGEISWAEQFAIAPTPLFISNHELRIYVGFCDSNMVSRVGFVDVSIKDPTKILRVSQTPSLDIGKPGTFDDNGVVPVSILDLEDRIRLYYVGFQLGVKVPYFMFTGVAESTDGGETFQRVKQTPVLERTAEQLYARCGTFVDITSNKYISYYIGSIGEGWTITNEGKKVPLYTLKYAESDDGINWQDDENSKILSFQNEDEHGFGRPFVWKEGNITYMLSSVRTLSSGYSIGLAKCENGKEWNRIDNEIEFVGGSEEQNSWESQNRSFPVLINLEGKKFIIYNGNKTGMSGFGIAQLIDS